jgi:ribosomal protein S18 acetylase RimI-like enzyme
MTVRDAGQAHVHIGRAVPEDAADLRLVIHAAMEKYARVSGIHGRLDALDESLDDLRRHIGQDAVFVARAGDSLIGTVRISVEPDGLAYLSRFAVLPGSQSRGIGSRLFAAAETYMKTLGVRQVRLHTALANHPLVRFYEARGFALESRSDDRGYPRGLFVKVFQAE